MNNEWNFCMGFGGWIIPLLIIALLYYSLNSKKESRSAAQDILDRRYANGGIDEQEYQEKSKQIREQTEAL